MRIYHDETGRTEYAPNFLADLEGKGQCNVFMCFRDAHRKSNAGCCAFHEWMTAQDLDESIPMTQDQIDTMVYWASQLDWADAVKYIGGLYASR